MTLTLSTTLDFFITFNSKNKDKGLEQWKKIYNHKDLNKYPLVAAYVSDDIKSINLIKALRMLENKRRD